MWQRIQSVFLGLAILCMLAALLLPILEGVNKEGEMYRLYPIYLMHRIKDVSSGPVYYPFFATAILIVAAMTISIQEFRRYDNRVLQVKLGTLNSLVLVGVMACIVLFSNSVIRQFPGFSWHYDLSLYLSFGATAMNWLAIRFIRRDEKLVRDSDRLR